MNLLATILDKDKCIGPNFLDWRQKLRVVLNSERIDYVLDNEPPKPLADEATAEERQTHKKWEDDELKVRSYIKASSSSQLLEQYEKMNSSSDIMNHLQELYDESSLTVSYEVTRNFSE
ncbi:hypothetical protein Patl1_20904 [Pistacia atlantica]|uniref:Uncharacterized protein n=1 Tax=Pistacia atlantica TaxID=434234 RepID=A0ACC1BK47_9ROSI|nr:hypothetical protein Patl1_20904 [Pistacia atlantica]